MASNFYPNVLTLVCCHPHSMPCQAPYVPISPAFDNRVAFPETRRTTRQLTYRHKRSTPVVSAIPKQLCKTVWVPLARPPVCTRQPPPRHSGLPLCGHPKLATASSPRTAQELGTLRPTLVPAFRIFVPGPYQLPDRQETHNDIPVADGC